MVSSNFVRDELVDGIGYRCKTSFERIDEPFIKKICV